MATYRPLAGSGGVTQGLQQQQQQQQQSADGDGFNGNGGVRTEWWWQAGPVDSCCCCCSLRTGVGLLAVDGFLSGIWTLFFLRAFYVSILETTVAFANDQYARNCADSAASKPACEDLKESVVNAEGLLQVMSHLPTVLYVQAVFLVVASAIGLWAVFFRSKRAAEVYMMTWPARFVLMVWGALEMHSLNMKYHVEQGYAGILYPISTFVLLYYFKVSWSYYKRRANLENAHASSRRSAPSDPAHPATPMLAMSTEV